MIIDKATLSASLRLIRTVVPTKNNLPVVQGVLLQNNSLVAYNMETGIRVPIESDVDEAFVIPLKAVDLIMKMPDGNIEITCDSENNLTVKNGKVRGKHASFPVQDFPLLPDVDAESSKITVDSTELFSVLDKVIYAISNDDNRPQFTGVIFKINDGNLDLVSTDSNRMAWGKIAYPDESKDGKGFIAPKFAVQRLLRMGIEGSIDISWDENVAVFQSAKGRLVTRLINGTIVNYGSVYPNHEDSLSVSRNRMLVSVERAMLMAEHDGVKLIVKDQAMTVQSKSSIGEYTDDIKLDKGIDGNAEIGLSGKFLSEALKNMGSDNIVIRLGSGSQPILLEDQSATISGILMPLRF